MKRLEVLNGLIEWFGLTRLKSLPQVFSINLLSGYTNISVYYAFKLLFFSFLKLYKGFYIILLLYIGLSILVLYINNLTKLFLKLSNSLFKLVGIFIITIIIVKFYRLNRLNGFNRQLCSRFILKYRRGSFKLKDLVTGYDIEYYFVLIR